MPTQFDLNDVRVFATVVDAGSMSTAAKRLGVSTSKVSRSITKLERYLGISLIRRGQHGIALTDAGSEYLPSCREALELLDTGQEMMAKQGLDPSGSIRVECPITTAAELLAPLLAKFTDQNARIRVEVFPYTPGAPLAYDDRTDIVFHLWPLRRTEGNTYQYPSSRRGIYASRKYVESLGTPSSIDDLCRFTFIGSSGNPAFHRWKLRGPTGEVELTPEFRVVACDPHVLRTMILDGLGISTLPVWMALRPGTHEHLVHLLPEWEPIPVPLLATYLRRGPLPPKIIKFLEFMGKHIGTADDPRAAGLDVKKCFI